jgi:hypothetical protein
VEESNLPVILGKLVSAAEEADMDVQQMIDLLNVGLSMEGLLLLIELRLEDKRKKAFQHAVPKRTM